MICPNWEFTRNIVNSQFFCCSKSSGLYLQHIAKTLLSLRFRQKGDVFYAYEKIVENRTLQMARYFLRISLKNKSHKFFHGTTFLHPFRSHGPGAEKIAWDHNKDEKSKAREGEDPDEGAAPAGVFPDIDSVVDNRCQGADQGAQPGAVHAVQ